MRGRLCANARIKAPDAPTQALRRHNDTQRQTALRHDCRRAVFCRCLKLPLINNIMLAGQYYAYKTYYTCKTILHLQNNIFAGRYITLTKRYYACKTYYTLTKHITLAKRYFVGKTSCGMRLLGARRRIYLRMLSQILSTAMIRAMRNGISSSLPSSSKESAPIMPRMTSICLRMVPIT